MAHKPVVRKRFGSGTGNHRRNKEVVPMKNNNKKRQTDKSVAAEPAEPGFATVVCPHFQRCKYGAIKSPKARHRCFGKLYKISHWETCIVIAFKCKLAGKRMLIEINGGECRHIPSDSPDYAGFQPRLKILKCNKCGKRILDYFQVCGEACVEAKCIHDGHPDVYPIGSTGHL